MLDFGIRIPCVAALAWVACSGAADAQVAPMPADPSQSTVQEGAGVDSTPARQDTTPSTDGDIVVTARRRDETVQKVPIAIDVVSDRALATTGAASLLQLQSVAPGVNLAKAPSGSEVGITIRGLGSAPGAPSFDTSVSLFIDGIYAGRSREFASSMFDVQRIEIIKGTQAALLGKNTSLGAVNLITRKPGDVFAVNARASYEAEYGSTLLAGGLDVPISRTLSIRIAGQTLDDRGWVRNVISGKRNTRNADDAIRGVLAWKPISGVAVTAFAQHDVTRLDGTPVEFVSTNARVELLQTLAGAPGTIETRLDRHNATSLLGLGNEQSETLRVDRYSVVGDIDLGGATLTFITGYSRYVDQNVADLDFQAGDYAVRFYREGSRNFSQEVRIVSEGGHRLDYVLGALYLRNKLDILLDTTNDYPFGPAPGVLLTGRYATAFDQRTTTGSFFGQTTLRLVDGLRATGGVRYTIEKKNVDLARTVIVPGFVSLVANPPYAPFSRGRKDMPFDYSGGLQYDVNPNILLYASYGKGTKSGGFASTATRLDRSEYSRETARTVEGGVKTQDPRRRWLFNASVFSTRVADFQVVTFNGTAFNIFNTDLRSRGFEVESYWYPVRPVRLFLNNTYTDAKDRNTGLRIPLAPKWSGSGGFAVRTPFNPRLDFMFDGSIDYRSSRSYQQDPSTATISPPFTTLNLSAALGRSDDRWEVRVIGRNLTDEIAPAFAFPTPVVGAQSVVPERGRTVAFQLSGRL